MAAEFGTVALGLRLFLHLWCVISLGSAQVDGDAGASQHANSQLPNGTVRLTGGFQPYQGRVEVYHRGIWGTICQADWGPSNALVVCRQLGFDGVNPSGQESFGEGTGPIYLEGLNCGGYENGLADCPKTAWAGSGDCDHTQDVGVTCSVGGDQATAAPAETKDGALRLADGTLPHNGRVEVYYQGEWGTICRDEMDVQVPDIVCKQLGYESADPPAAVPAGGYGPGPGVIQLGNVMCEGNEAKLAFCAHDKWGENDCTHADDVMISCKTYTPPEDGDIRLVAGGDIAQGQVEINYQGVWGTVCDTDWTIKDATVVCRQLGFQPARASLSYSYFLDEDSTSPIFFDSVECEGSEARLEDCTHSWRGGACQHFEDVGVICGAPLVFKPETSQDGRVRLRSGTYPHNGRVEIKYQGEWGTMCDQGWNMDAANVVCRQLGYPSAESALPRAFFGQGSGVIHLDQVTCEGRESELAFCNHAKWGENECEHGQDASVVCTAALPAGATPDGSVRLVGGEAPNLAGRLQVLYQRVWGTVCGTDWLDINSDVACKQLGYWSANPANPAYDDPDTGSSSPVMLAGVRCTGDEQRLVDCSHNGWALTDCTHEGDVGITCIETRPTTPTPEPTTSRPVITTVRLSTESPILSTKAVTVKFAPSTLSGNKTDASGDNNNGLLGHSGGQGSTTSDPGENNHTPTKAAFPPIWVIVVLVLMVPTIVIIFAIGIYVKKTHRTSYKPVDHGAMPMPERV